jgi:hypothetical protein
LSDHRSPLLQVRVSPEALAEIRRRAKAAETDVSAYVLDRVLPDWPRVDGRTMRRLRRLEIAPAEWAAARELARRLAPGDRLGVAELGDLRAALAEVLREQELGLAEDAGEIEVVRLSE